jgi:predicted house-cleaning noncanonical NTP pyrophosphatase (MazG superfamily)
MKEKLVRDLIPQIIEKDGRKTVTRIAKDEEYIQLLLNKLHEEVEELSNAKKSEIVNECADIIEVLDAILKFNGYTLDDALEKKSKKRLERGGFENRIVLERIIEKKR